jgi:hypothetical protein
VLAVAGILRYARRRSMSIPKWTAGFPSFAEEMRMGEEIRRKEKEAVMAEERRMALLRRKLLILQISLASEWAVEQMAKGWRPQISGQGLEEQVAAALAMIKMKDPDDPRRQMAEQGLEDLENWTP